MSHERDYITGDASSSLVYGNMLAETYTFNDGMRHGIDHAVLVIRQALAGDDIVGVYAHKGLENLRRDILELRRNTKLLLQAHGGCVDSIRKDYEASADADCEGEAGDVPEITRKLSPTDPEVREFLLNPKPGQIIQVPEHRLKDYAYDKAAGRDTSYLLTDCVSDDPARMCERCNCWKRTRAYCA